MPKTPPEIPVPAGVGGSYITEAWATDRPEGGTGAPARAVKITVMRETTPNATEVADYRAQAQGLFRRQYQQWSMDTGCTTRRPA